VRESMTVEEIIKILEIENEYMVSHGEEGQSIALVSAMKALKVQEKLEKALEEIICEYNLCYKYIAEEDMEKDKTEHERLALEITSSCMQTLGYLIDNYSIHSRKY